MTPRKPVFMRSRHGLIALKAKVKVRGLHAIDMRTAAAQDMIARKLAWIEDMGGEEAISAKQKTLIDLAAQTWLFIDSIDAWLLQQPSLINHRKRAVLPVLLQRQQLADALARYMTQLGLERRAKLVPDLQAYLAQKSQK